MSNDSKQYGQRRATRKHRERAQIERRKARFAKRSGSPWAQAAREMSAYDATAETSE